MARLLFIGPNLTAGGAERQWSILVPGLAARGHDAHVIALDVGGPFVAPLREAGITVEVLRMRHQADLGRLLASPTLRGFAAQAVISRGPSGLYVGHAVARARRAGHLYADHRQVGLPASRRRELMVRLLASRLDNVVIVSAGQAAVWRGRGVAEQRIVLVPNGVPSPTPPAGTRERVRRALGIAPDAVVAITVASMRPVKRHPDFVRGVRLTAQTHPGLVGIVVGEGPDRPAIEAAAGGDRAIHLLGHRDDVPDLLAAADVFVLASEFEAAPMAILEAMAAGLPVIATAVGSVPDLVLDGLTGRLVAPGQPEAIAGALAGLLQDPGRRRAMGEAGAARHRAAFSAEAMIDHYERLIVQATA